MKPVPVSTDLVQGDRTVDRNAGDKVIEDSDAGDDDGGSSNEESSDESSCDKEDSDDGGSAESLYSGSLIE